jgi:hypothetical protein
MFFSDFKFDDWFLFHFDKLLILFTFFFSCLQIDVWQAMKKLLRPKTVFRFSNVHSNSVHINSHVLLLWLQIRWSVTFSLWWIYDFVFLFFFFVFKLMFGKPWKKLSRPKKVFRFSDFRSNSVHINSHVLLWLQIRWLVTFSLWWIVDFIYFFFVFKLMFGKPWKKLSRSKKVFRFSNFHSNCVYMNIHVLR